MSTSKAFKQGFMDAMKKIAEGQAASAYDVGRAAMNWSNRNPANTQYTGTASNLVDRIGQYLLATRPGLQVWEEQTKDGTDFYPSLRDEDGTRPWGLRMPDDVLAELSIPDRDDDGTSLSASRRTGLVQKALAPRIDKLVPGTGGNTGYPARYISVPNPLYKTEQP